jgi:sortase A
MAVTCLLASGLLLGERAWLSAKARLAAALVDAAFRQHLLDGAAHRPWSWADTHPVARLEVPRLGVRRTVLEGASGSSLAFGPGHVDGTAAPNARGNCVLAGHRDSWFAFLSRLTLGDQLRLRTRQGEVRYEVTWAGVVSMWDRDTTAASTDRRLTLVTCYPFDGLTESEWRFVVRCREQATGAGGRPVGKRPDAVIPSWAEDFS